MEDIIFERYEGFQRDEGNSLKNWKKHNVTISECEQVFFNKPMIVSSDEKHSDSEKRWFLLGRTDLDRKLFLVFTSRGNLIRVVSARDMNKKERDIYNEEIEKHTEI
ncbi:MAG: BrnT family toxin [Ignavibacteriales bacterium]|nr:BrnT family toxin [Ignavibacteriales bacterium]